MATKTAAVIIAIAVGLCAWLYPRMADEFFRRSELRAASLARRPLLFASLIGMAVLLVRAALLPLVPIPQPSVADELSYVLAADTFVHGRLANPVHPLWRFFETTHVLMHPTYASKYFPGQGLFLAAGQVLTGRPWFGVWISCGLMAAAVAWAAFGWLPPAWAMLAGLLVLPVSILSPYMNSYWGGAVAAIGGALATGAAGRLLSGRFSSGTACAAFFSLGSVMLCWTRPLEGLTLIAVLLAALAIKRSCWPSASALIVFSAIAVCGATWLGYYNFRVTGSPWNIPEVEYQRQFGSVPFLNFLPLGQPREIRDPHLRIIVNVWEHDLILKARTLRGQWERWQDMRKAATLFAGAHWLFLAPLILFIPWLARDRRVRVLLLALACAAAVATVEIAYFIHYAAPFCAAVVIVAAQGFRHLRVWRIGARPVGRFLSRAFLVLGLTAMLVVEGREWIRRSDIGDPLAFWLAPGRRSSLEDSLPAEGRHVILVRYAPPYQMHSHWVYNHADVDATRVVWAHDLGPEENKQLLAYYPDRKFWLLRPNQDPGWLEPYHWNKP